MATAYSFIFIAYHDNEAVAIFIIVLIEIGCHASLPIAAYTRELLHMCIL